MPRKTKLTDLSYTDAMCWVGNKLETIGDRMTNVEAKLERLAESERFALNQVRRLQEEKRTLLMHMGLMVVAMQNPNALSPEEQAIANRTRALIERIAPKVHALGGNRGKTPTDQHHGLGASLPAAGN